MHACDPSPVASQLPTRTGADRYSKGDRHVQHCSALFTSTPIVPPCTRRQVTKFHEMRGSVVIIACFWHSILARLDSSGSAPMAVPCGFARKVQ